MKISDNKQPNKYVALVTYCIALICLLAGLFVPLFGGDILALQFGGIIDGIAGTSLSSAPYYLAKTGTVTFGGFSFDFTALAILLYAVVTALGLIFLVPIGFSVKKGTSSSFVLEYIIEVSAVIFLALCLIPALQLGIICYNLIIAVGGAFVMLVILSFVTKGFGALVKFILALLGILVYLSLFNISLIVSSLTLTGSVNGGFFGETASVFTLTYLFNAPSQLFADASSVADKTIICLCLIAGLIAVINFCIDVIALSVNKKRSTLIFNIARYALASACAVSAIITVLAGGYSMGIMLILFAGASVLQLVISTARFCIATKSAKIDDLLNSLDDDNTYRFEKRIEHREPAKAKPVRAELMDKNVTDIPDDGPVQVTIMDIEEISPSSPVIEEIKPVQPETVQEVKPIEPVQEVKPVEPIQPEPVQEVKPLEPVQPEPVQEVKPVEPVQPEPVQEVKPVQPVQPEPVQEVKPVQPVQPEPVQEVKPVQPVQPEPVQEVKPVQPVQPQPTTQIYTINTIYGGPVDDFMRKLTNDEKIEFARTFIERVNGNIGNIPEYVIGGNNRAFFSSVFIYLGRVRGLISDNLLNKMYKELNIL